MHYKIDVVMGLNYGDEGKGLVTNCLADENSLVILPTNSCQRGHTVEYNGMRHVFHHFGSGTLKGAATYIAAPFIVNPTLFRREWEELAALGITPKVYVEDGCTVGTPMDMFANRLIEDSRGNDRHGSVGIGVWETMKRNYNCLAYGTNSMLTFQPWHIESKQKVESTIVNMRRYYAEYLAKRFSGDYTKKIADFYGGEYLVDNIVEDFYFMLSHVQIVNQFERRLLVKEYSHIIFELGQGLMLDEKYSYDPLYSTPMETDCHSAYLFINRIYSMTDELEISLDFVTRPYVTRHGAGPMGYGIRETHPQAVGVFEIDETNQPNQYQGDFRYGRITPTYIEKMKTNISRCLEGGSSLMQKVSFSNRIIITHWNELENVNLARELHSIEGIDGVWLSANKETIYGKYETQTNKIIDFSKKL